MQFPSKQFPLIFLTSFMFGELCILRIREHIRENIREKIRENIREFSEIFPPTPREFP